VAALFECRDPEVLVEGRAGTGKSIGLTYEGPTARSSTRLARILICRQTRESVHAVGAGDVEEKVLGPTHPLVVHGPGPQNRSEYRYPNGSVIVVGGLDKPEKLFSTEWDWST
jgi:hypothetical protein